MAGRARITLVGEETLLPYDRPPLSKAMITDEQEPQPVYLLDEGMLASLKATLLRGVRATGNRPRQQDPAPRGWRSAGL